MTQSREESFPRIAPVDDLPDGKPKIFRAAGATVVLLRNGQSVEAIDGSCVSDDADMNAAMRLTRILDCVAAGLGRQDGDWKSLVEKGWPGRPDRRGVGVAVPRRLRTRRISALTSL